MGVSWRIGKPLGIPVEVDFSAMVIMGVIAVLLGTNFSSQFPGFDGLTYALLGISAAVCLFISVLAHEFCHALVARHDGLRVEGITLFAFGGVARLAEEPRNAREELRMAAAGPACSLVLGFVLLVGLFVLGPGRPQSAAIVLLGYLGTINVALGLFNLVPGFPLDGGRILRALLWGTTRNFERATWASAALGQAVALLLVFWGAIRIYEGTQDAGFLGASVGGFFFIFTGLFLYEAARRSYAAVAQQVTVKIEAEAPSDPRPPSSR